MVGVVLGRARVLGRTTCLVGGFDPKGVSTRMFVDDVRS